MPYCTIEQLEDRYSQRMLIELSDRGDTAPEEPDAELLARAISDADSLIDGYLKVRYALPLETVPALVIDLSLRVAIYNAHAHVAPEKIAQDYKDALRTLEHISKGMIQLDVEGIEPAASGAAEVRTNEPERPFTAATMKGFI